MADDAGDKFAGSKKNVNRQTNDDGAEAALQANRRHAGTLAHECEMATSCLGQQRRGLRRHCFRRFHYFD